MVTADAVGRAAIRASIAADYARQFSSYNVVTNKHLLKPMRDFMIKKVSETAAANKRLYTTY